nr:hypothetical protein CFP56_48007 [Quercus suber]
MVGLRVVGPISVLVHSQKTVMTLLSSVMKMRHLLLGMGPLLKRILRISTCNESFGIIVPLNSFWTTGSFPFTIYNRLSTLHRGSECRYERVHKLCTRCGLTDHMKGQCNEKPQFHNKLRAFYNRRRRWTTQVRYGNLQQPHHSHAHFDSTPASPVPNPSNPEHLQDENLHLFPDLETPHIPNPPSIFSSQHPMDPTQLEHEHTTLNSTILSLSLSNHPISQTPLNSPASFPYHPPNPVNSPNHNLDHTMHTSQPPEHNPKSSATFTLCPPCALPSESNMYWTWVGENGPFMTNGTLRKNSRSNFDTDNDETVLLFNLDRLNEDCLDWVRRDAWSRGQTPVVPDLFIDNLVQRMDRNRLRFEVGDSSAEPQIRRPQDLVQDESWTQYLADNKPKMESAHNCTVSLDTGLSNICNTEITNLGLGHPPLLQEGTNFDTFEPPSSNFDSACYTNEEAPFYPKRCWEADLIIFPNSHEDPKLKLRRGDFNQFLNNEEKFSFSQGSIMGAKLFQQVISHLQLCDLAASRRKHTWMNNREGNELVMERLNKAFAFVEWVNMYPLYSFRNLPIIRSDHGLILLDFEFQTPFRSRLFRFELMWTKHPNCKSMIQQAWSAKSTGSRAAQLRCRILNVKKTTVEWNKYVFGKVERDNKFKQAQLQQIQNSFGSIEDVRKERQLRCELKT